MTPEQISDVLAYAAKIDPRLNERTHADAALAVEAWRRSLNPHITFDFAIETVTKTCARPGYLNEPRLTPGDINGAYRKLVASQQDGTVFDTMRAAKAESVPPTEQSLAAREQLTRKVPA